METINKLALLILCCLFVTEDAAARQRAPAYPSPGSCTSGLFGLCPGLNNNVTPEDIGLTDLLAERQGFGYDTTGGATGSMYLVTSLANDGPNSLREGCGLPGPVWIVFGVSGEIPLLSKLDCSSDKTVDGRFSITDITGFGFRIASPCSLKVDNCFADPGLENIVQNVIITNVRVMQVTADAIQLAGAHRVWINRNTLIGDGIPLPDPDDDATDGLLDVSGSYAAIAGGARVLISWNKFSSERKTMLLGEQSTGFVKDKPWLDDKNLRVTLHHNYFNSTYERNPRVARARVHAFNNVVSKWGVYGSCAGEGARLFIQDTYFIAQSGDHGPALIDSCGVIGGGYVKNIRPKTSGSVTYEITRSYPADDFSPNTELNYLYATEPMTEALRDRIINKAGRQ